MNGNKGLIAFDVDEVNSIFNELFRIQIDGLKLALCIVFYGFNVLDYYTCLLYTSPSPRDRQKSRMPSSA